MAGETPPEADTPPRRRWVKPVVLVLILVGLLTVGKLYLKAEHLENLFNWIEGLGPRGPVVVGAFYIVACVAMLPGSVLTLGAGFLFGVPLGLVTVSVGSTLGACAAFLVGRTVARNWVAGKVGDNPKFAAIDRAVGREGWKIVLLLRLSPVFPFNLLNYGLGLTKVPFWHYALASWIGMIPGTIMYVYFGSTLKNLADVVAGNVETGGAGKAAFWIGLAVTVGVTVHVTRLARAALARAVEEDGDG